MYFLNVFNCRFSFIRNSYEIYRDILIKEYSTFYWDFIICCRVKYHIPGRILTPLNSTFPLQTPYENKIKKQICEITVKREISHIFKRLRRMNESLLLIRSINRPVKKWVSDNILPRKTQKTKYALGKGFMTIELRMAYTFLSSFEDTF